MVTRQSIWALVCGIGMLGTGAAHAAEVDGVLKAGFDFGGESLTGDVLFESGHTENLRANEGFFVGAGVALLNTPRTLGVEITLNWKYGTVGADNGDVEFTRFPVDALLFYNFPRARIAVGATYHLNPELDSDGLGAQYAVKTEFDDALGFMTQLDWRITQKVALGLRYTVLDYEVANGGGTVGSDGLGFAFTTLF